MDLLAKSLKAKEIMEDAVFLAIFGDLESKYINDWRNSQPGETQKRETAHAGMRALEDIKGRLHSIANAPKVDAHNNRNAAKR